MPAPVLTYDDVNVTTTNTDGTVSSAPIGSGTGDTLFMPDNFSEYALQITSNVAGATINVNGTNLANTTPYVYRVQKRRLLIEDLEITISKEGYNSVEKYILSINNPNNSVFIENANLQYPLGLNGAGVSIEYYLNGTFESKLDNTTSNFKSLEFSRLYKVPSQTSTELLSLEVRLSGPKSSVRLTKNKLSEVFPKRRRTTYKDVENTLFFINSANTNLFLIKKIILDEGQTTEKIYEAKENESLSLSLNLTKDSTLYIESEQVRRTPKLDPIVSLYNIPKSFEYNLNSETGIPLTFRKNKDVTAITIIVGDDILEFDELGDGDIFGVKIPHNVFNNIGKYNIKVYPFSFDDYEDIFNPTQPVIEERIVRETKIKEEPVVEEVVSPAPLPPRYNPYSPIISTGGSGGGGSRPMVMFDEQQNQNINPFTNNGSFVNRPGDNVNIR